MRLLGAEDGVSVALVRCAGAHCEAAALLPPAAYPLISLLHPSDFT